MQWFNIPVIANIIFFIFNEREEEEKKMKKCSREKANDMGIINVPYTHLPYSN